MNQHMITMAKIMAASDDDVLELIETVDFDMSELGDKLSAALAEDRDAIITADEAGRLVIALMVMARMLPMLYDNEETVAAEIHDMAQEHEVPTSTLRKLFYGPNA